MAVRAVALLAMRPDVADAAFPDALRTRLDAVVETDHGLAVTDFAEPLPPGHPFSCCRRCS